MANINAIQQNNQAQASFSSEEILSFLEKNGTIDPRGVEEGMRKARRNKLLTRHCYTVYDRNTDEEKNMMIAAALA